MATTTPPTSPTPISRLASALPLNRVVAFFGPAVALLAGAVASWLGRHFPGLHLDPTSVTGQVTQVVNFAIGALVTFALQHKWLDGWQKWEAAATGAPPPGAISQIAALTTLGAALIPPPIVPLVPAGDYDPARDTPVTTGRPADPATPRGPAVATNDAGVPRNG